MATKKEIINLQVEYGSLEKLNAELAATNKELEQVGIGSDEFKKLSKRAQQLESAVGDVNTQIEGFSAEKKFMAADGAVKAFGGAVAAAVGSMSLLGIETETLGNLEEKAAGALAFAVGIKDVSEGYKQLKDSTALATAAQKTFQVATKAGQAIMKLFNITAAANPIGVLIVSLTAVGALIYAFRDSIMNLIKTALGPFSGIIDSIVGAFNDLAVAVGLADDEQTKATKANIERMEEELALAQAKGEDTLEIEKNLLKEKRKLLDEGTKEYKDSLLAEKVMDAKAKTDKEKADEEAAKVAEDKRKAAAEKRRAEAEANQNQYLSLLQKLADEELNLQAKTAEEKLKLEYDRQLKEIDALKVSEEEKNKAKLLAEENYNIKLNEQKDTQAVVDSEKQAEREQIEKDRQLELKTLEAETLEEERLAAAAILEEDYNRQIAAAKQAGEDTTTLEKIKLQKLEKLNEDYAKKEKDIEDAKRQVVEVTNDMAVDAAQQALTSIFGDNKAVASANVLVDAGQAAVGILNTSFQSGNPIAAIAFQVAQFATLAATTVSSLKQINSAKPGGGGGGGRTTPNVNTSLGGLAPQALPPADIAITETIQPAVKAYVVQGDVRSASEAEAKIASRRTLD